MRRARLVGVQVETSRMSFVFLSTYSIGCLCGCTRSLSGHGPLAAFSFEIGCSKNNRDGSKRARFPVRCLRLPSCHHFPALLSLLPWLSLLLSPQDGPFCVFPTDFSIGEGETAFLNVEYLPSRVGESEARFVMVQVGGDAGAHTCLLPSSLDVNVSVLYRFPLFPRCANR